MIYKNLVLIGTSHIAKASIDEIKEAFHSVKPNFVAVELDKRRLASLLSNKSQTLGLSNIRFIGVKGYLFALLGHYVQKKLGSIVQIKPGSDMLEGVNLARQNNKKLFLVDQDITITLKKFSKNLSFEDIWHFFMDLLFGWTKKRRINISLNTVPDKKTIEFVMDFLQTRYPGVYYTLVEDRNSYMAKKIFKIMLNNPSSKILAIVGAGHETGIMEKIKKLGQSNISLQVD